MQVTSADRLRTHHAVRQASRLGRLAMHGVSEAEIEKMNAGLDYASDGDLDSNECAGDLGEKEDAATHEHLDSSSPRR